MPPFRISSARPTRRGRTSPTRQGFIVLLKIKSQQLTTIVQQTIISEVVSMGISFVVFIPDLISIIVAMLVLVSVNIGVFGFLSLSGVGMGSWTCKESNFRPFLHGRSDDVDWIFRGHFGSCLLPHLRSSRQVESEEVGASPAGHCLADSPGKLGDLPLPVADSLQTVLHGNGFLQGFAGLAQLGFRPSVLSRCLVSCMDSSSCPSF